MSSTRYNRQSSFALFSAENPNEQHSGATLDAEFNAVKLAVDNTQQNLALIQDDDGALKRGSVGKAQFDAGFVGFGAPANGSWRPAIRRNVDTVFEIAFLHLRRHAHV